MNKKLLVVSGSLLVLALPGVAAAHPGHDAGASFAAGALHPLAGVDHLCALIAVGLLAGRTHARTGVFIAMTFLVLMSAGMLSAFAGFELPGVEWGIAASIVAMALLAWRPPHELPVFTAALAGLFAIFHGHAHGAEAASGTLKLAYASGLLITSAVVIRAAMVAARLPGWSRTRLQHRKH